MLLAIDAGNTNTVLGLFQGKRLKRTWRIVSEPRAIRGLAKKLSAVIDSVIVASVVPSLNGSFGALSRSVCGKRALFVNGRMKMPIRIRLKDPRSVGQDRIVNAAATYHRWKGPVIIVDFGTATTCDVVTADGDYIGGTISPGIGIANAALHEKTALLPLVPLRKPRRVIGDSTVTAIESGLFYGYIDLIDGLVKRIKKEMRSPKVKVIATGGLSTMIGPACETIEVLEPDLTLQGLRLLYEWNRGAEL